MDPQYTPFIILGGVLVTLFGILFGMIGKLDRKQSESNAVSHEAIGLRITEMGQRIDQRFTDMGQSIERMETRMVERLDKIASKLG